MHLLCSLTGPQDVTLSEGPKIGLDTPAVTCGGQSFSVWDIPCCVPGKPVQLYRYS